MQHYIKRLNESEVEDKRRLRWHWLYQTLLTEYRHIANAYNVFYSYDRPECLFMVRKLRTVNMSVFTILRTSEKCYRLMYWHDSKTQYATFRTAGAVFEYIQAQVNNELTSPEP